MTGLTAKPALEEQNLDRMVHWESLSEEAGNEREPSLAGQENPRRMPETVLKFGEGVIALMDKLTAYLKTKQIRFDLDCAALKCVSAARVCAQKTDWRFWSFNPFL